MFPMLLPAHRSNVCLSSHAIYPFALLSLPEAVGSSGIQETRKGKRHMSIEVSMYSDRRFRALIEHSSDAIELLTPEFTVTYASPSTERVTGYTAEELVGMNGFALLHPDDLEDVQQQLSALLDRPGDFITVEYRICHKDSTWRWMEATLTNLLDDPAVEAVVCNYRDITQRKQGQEPLRQEEEVTEQVQARRRVEELNRQLEAEKEALLQAQREAEVRTAELSAILEAMTEGVSVCDARGEIRYTNAAYRSLLALEEDADPYALLLDHRFAWLATRNLEGRPLPKEHHPVLRVLKGERLSGANTLELLCHTYKGEDIIVNVSGAPIRDAAGQIVGGVVVFRDVTGRYRLEQQLRYSESKLRSLVESNILGVVVADVDGRIYEINDRVAQMVGYSKDELLSKTFNWQQLVPPDSHEAQAQTTKVLLSTGALPPTEGEYLRKDGSRLPVLTAATLLDQERRLALGVILDISDRKAAERRKQEFLSMVSHELRTPLMAILGGIELALLHIELRPSSLAPEAEGLINQIERVLKRAGGQVEIEARLVEELLDVSRLEMHKFELSLQRENLVTIVLETVANQQAARARNIELILPPDELVPVIADAGRIEQVLTNYLTNALKYTPVEQAVSVHLEVEASVARVSVRDQGPGLTPEQQHRVWERFYQAAAPGLRGPDRGLGLGLAIAKAIIEQHQGQVGVESAPGHGSTFWFTVPLANGLIQA